MLLSIKGWRFRDMGWRQRYQGKLWYVLDWKIQNGYLWKDGMVFWKDFCADVEQWWCYCIWHGQDVGHGQGIWHVEGLVWNKETMKEKRRNYGSNQLIAWIHAFYDIIYKFKKILIKTFTGCPTLLETVNLELKFSLIVGVMVVKFQDC